MWKCVLGGKRRWIGITGEKFLRRLGPTWGCKAIIMMVAVGQCLLKLGDINKAQEYAQKAVQAGSHEFCFELLIKILMLQKEVKAAVAVSNAAVEYV
ncbi:unnamed protein product [Diabrotica balteata]|uniref:Uncharacterized protein n=1 Tax=Diabrotica balteata TaxID=107213 RepID=A0A9N9T2E3_DIABA|nr:unnamed protein product [Diabrotica balteata]